MPAMMPSIGPAVVSRSSLLTGSVIVGNSPPYYVFQRFAASTPHRARISIMPGCCASTTTENIPSVEKIHITLFLQ
jgi:hypothetical protein